MAYKDKQKAKEQSKIRSARWAKENPEKRKESFSRYNKQHPERNKCYIEKLRLERPWKLSLMAARNRCKFSKCYANKRITCTLTESQIKYLWFRDRAGKMFKPSLDRLDAKCGYVVSNCRFIELKYNVARKLILTEEEELTLKEAVKSSDKLIQKLVKIYQRII
jgi:hypothetical protein